MSEKFTVAKENRYIIPVSIIVALTIIAAFWAVACIAKSYIASNAEVEKLRLEIERDNIRLNVRFDKFTYCLQSVMEQSIKAGKHVDAKYAKEICKDVETK